MYDKPLTVLTVRLDKHVTSYAKVCGSIDVGLTQNGLWVLVLRLKKLLKSDKLIFLY